MPGDEVVTAYSVAVPKKQEQSLPGLDKDMNRTTFYLVRAISAKGSTDAYILAGLEYSKQEVWDDEGKPHLVEYVGAGK